MARPEQTIASKRALSSEAYLAELLDNIVPFWESHCPDRDFGAYFNCLDRDGKPYDFERHLWMQWRTVYTFSELAVAEFGKPEWRKLAESGFEFLVAHGKSEDGSYYFSLNREGVPASAPHSIFTDAFAAMGSAALYRASGREDCRKEAISAMDSYLKRVGNPKGRWSKAMPGRKPRLSFGSQMILANLGTVMEEKLGDSRYSDATREAVESVMGSFLNPELGVLFESVNPDGSFDMDSSEGRHLNPGHGLEALWFVMDYASRKGRKDLIEKALPAVKRTLEFAWDKEHGGLYYFMDAAGRPCPELEWDMKLWWVHCEALVAALMAYDLGRAPETLVWLKRLHEWTWSRFPDPGHGEWFAYLNRRGEPSSTLKGGKWKCFFHLPRMLLVCSKTLKRLEKEKAL